MKKHFPFIYSNFLFRFESCVLPFSRFGIDIGIEGPEEIPGRVHAKTREELDRLPALYTFDIVDFKKVSPGFRKAAEKNMEYVH